MLISNISADGHTARCTVHPQRYLTWTLDLNHSLTATICCTWACCSEPVLTAQQQLKAAPDDTPILCCAGAIAYGLLSILLITPLLGLLAVQLPLQPPGLALGLGVFCAMPTALSSGITFTQVRRARRCCLPDDTPPPWKVHVLDKLTHPTAHTHTPSLASAWLLGAACLG
jgi:hypothetical protein